VRKKTAENREVEVVSWRAMLEAIPRRNLAAQVEVTDTGATRVSVPLRRPWWMIAPVKWVMHPTGRKTVGLDSLGTEVLELCDGSRSVERIVDEFAARHKLTFHESRVAVTGFLRSLVQRGTLAIEQK
jgi:hypothetical protein